MRSTINVCCEFFTLKQSFHQSIYIKHSLLYGLAWLCVLVSSTLAISPALPWLIAIVLVYSVSQQSVATWPLNKICISLEDEDYKRKNCLVGFTGRNIGFDVKKTTQTHPAQPVSELTPHKIWNMNNEEKTKRQKSSFVCWRGKQDGTTKRSTTEPATIMATQQQQTDGTRSSQYQWYQRYVCSKNLRLC